MKKLFIVITIVLCVTSSLFAAKEFVTVAMSSSYNSKTENFGLGFYSQYQFEAALTDKMSLGFGSFIDCDFSPRGLAKDTIYRTYISFSCGPSFSSEISDIATLSFLVGPLLDMLDADDDSYYEDLVGYGISSTLSLTLTPLKEQESRVQLGFTGGINCFTTFFDGDKANFGARVFFGINVLQPFWGIYYPDIYDAVIDSVYND